MKMFKLLNSVKKNVKENYRMLKNIKECEKCERMLKNVKEY